MKASRILFIGGLLAGCLLFATPAAGAPTPALEDGWANPPTSARLRAYWWWLNGNVTKAAITRDLEEMKAKGFGGALICDAGGAEQDGNDRVPHGPTFFTPEWRELYQHALREAGRLGLEMSLNIQSGWNLGGPMVSAEDAAKKLVWTEAKLTGPAKIEQALPVPKHRDNYYRDALVVAYRINPEARSSNALASFSASSEQAENPASAAGDGNNDTFWVSGSDQPGQGPSRERPQWLQVDFAQAVSVDHLTLAGRPGYGPSECELQARDEAGLFRPVRSFAVPENGKALVEFDAVSSRSFRLMIFGAFDPRSAASPRNVQIAELQLSGKDGAFPRRQARRPIRNWEQKAIHRALHFSAPDTTPLFEEWPAEPGEADTRSTEVVDLTSRLGQDGKLRWNVPAGDWQVLRFGYTIGDHSRVSTCSDGWQGYALDVLEAGAFQRYWDAVIEPLIADAGPLAGKALKYLHTDSWEVEPLNWTANLPKEFRRRRGYDLLPFLPALTGRIVDSRKVSNRFLHDFRKTLGDLAIDQHYRVFRDNAHRHGLLIHPESGGPHAVPIDAQRCLGWDDAPMSEFWAWSWRHRVGDPNRFFVKQPASAAHTYGHRLVLAEGFTTIGPHWQETIWDNLKPSFDKALCEGLNLLVWHAFVCSPAEMGMPGQQYFAGTHFNPNSTWWSKSAPFLAYLNRCQFLLQQGLFVADVCYYYGDHVPNFAQLKQSDPARILPGYDYDVITEEALLTRASVRDGRLTLPDGMSYRLLVLPERTVISLSVLRKLKQLVTDGATVLGPKPASASTLENYPRCDAQVARLANDLWGKADRSGREMENRDGGAPTIQSGGSTLQSSAAPSIRRVGRGRVVTGCTARELLLHDGIQPDFDFTVPNEAGPRPAASPIDYIHRTADNAEIYFVANRTNHPLALSCSFRVTGKAPELWDAVSGERRFADAYSESEGRTTVPLEFTPCGSWFVVFRAPASQHRPTAQSNARKFDPVQELTGPWTVKFDPKWGGPESVQFASLVSWPTRPEPGIKYYSGTATYLKTFDLPSGSRQTHHASRIALDLGQLRELAEVRLNGKSLGIVWTPPFRVDITSIVKPTGNQLEIEVVNFWPNRIIGDDALPPAQRLTRTNIRKLTKDTALMESGLLGPVRILEVH